MRKLAWSASFSLFVFATASADVLDSLYRRNLSCRPRFSAPRARQICEALEREMEWTWSGHAIIAPSFRVTFATVKKVYCVLSVTAQDTPSLVRMIVQTERKTDGTMADMQLQNGGRFLLYALGKQALSAFPDQQNNWDKLEQQIAKNLKEEIALYSAAPGVIWNPANPQYLFRNGCR
jgi:hypothetical protein